MRNEHFPVLELAAVVEFSRMWRQNEQVVASQTAGDSIIFIMFCCCCCHQLPLFGYCVCVIVLGVNCTEKMQ